MEDDARVSARAAALCFAALVAVAAVLRLQGVDWDSGQHLHPDERFLTMVAAVISPPRSLAEYFSTPVSPLNPSNHGYRFFVYGTLPLFLVRFLAQWLGMTGYEQVHLVGRTLSALFDLGTLSLTVSLGSRIGGRRVGLIAGALLAFSVTSIQNAHFFTVDAPAAFFATAALWALVELAETGSVAAHLLFALTFGATLGCRINLALLGAIYPLAFAHAWRTRRTAPHVLARGAMLAGIVAPCVFRIVQPYAFAGPGFFDVRIAPDFLFSMRQIRAFATGAADYPPSVQWIGRTPIWFAGKNLLLWGTGPAWGIAALGGAVAWLLGRPKLPPGERALGGIALAWALLLFTYHASQFAATGRYFLPIVPVLALSAAWLLGRDGSRRRSVLACSVIALTAVWAIAFTAIYRRPISRVEASRWIYGNVPAGSTIANEHWDDPLPLPLPDSSRARYRLIQLHLYDDDTVGKRRTLVEQLAAADYIAISSNRLYRSIPRTPWRYPLTRRYYELLFSGELGFRLERSFTSYPRLGPLEIRDDEAEEAFTVYDHPHVLIFRKTEAFSRQRVEDLLDGVRLDGILEVPPRYASALYRRTRPTDVPLPEPEAVRTAVAAGEEGSLGALVRWMVTFEVLSLAVFALVTPAMRMTPDRGFGLAKLLAWVVPGYVAWLLSSTGLAASTPATARGVGSALAAAAVAVAWRRRRALAEACRQASGEIVVVEAVFLLVAAVFLATRALNPAIIWGEKPMDFAFLNSLLRSRTMPPADPWFAGETLNYFYFGHALVAFVTEMAGVPPAFAFNLAIGTIAGLLAVAAFLVGRRVGGGRLAGVLAALAVTVIGNLHGARLLDAWPQRPFDFDYFWATSRVVPGTINEFPVWNLLFADLHAHVLAQPLEVALLYVGLLWLGDDRHPPPHRLFVSALAALLIGALAATSAWSSPTAVALQLAFLVTAWRRNTARARDLAAVIAGWLAIVLLSRVLFWPFWSSYRPPIGRSWVLETAKAPIGDVLTIYGLFLVVVVPMLVARGLGCRRRGGFWLATLAIGIGVATGLRLRAPAGALFGALTLLGAAVWWLDDSFEGQITGLLVAFAGALGVGTDAAFLWDPMNTDFKCYLEMWLLLACAAGAILPWAWRQSGRWRVPWAAVIVIGTAAGGFTAASAAVALLRSPFVKSDVPTLDGTSYLSRTRPSELAAFRWLDRQVAGIPVVLEAHGDSYGEFSRVSVNTGLPTVLGWEYHLFQQAHPWAAIVERRDDVETLFSTTDLDLAARLMEKYRVDLVFVGALERRTYPTPGLAKFATWPLTKPVFENDDVTIYGTPGIVHSVKTWIEAIAPSPGALAVPPFGMFHEPRGLARAPDGTIFVADFGNRRIQHLSQELRALGGFGAKGDQPGQFRDPCGVAVGPDGAVYVADTWNHRIQKLSPQGKPIAQWTPHLYGPRGIALDRHGRIYVADTGNGRVLRLSANGIVEREWGREGNVLSAPVGVAVSASGEVYVADTGHRRVVVFTADGEILRVWPVDGWRVGEFVEPYLAVGPDGVVWVTDGSANRVLLFDPNGRPLGVAAPDTPLSMPLGIAVLDSTHAAVSNARSHSLAIVSRTSKTSVVPE